MMITYLPLANVTNSLQALHNDDLIDQVIQAGRTLRQVAEEEGHPSLIVNMWRGYEGGLWNYFLQCCQEWKRRGNSATTFLQYGHQMVRPYGYDRMPPLMPRWYGWRPLHDSHASTLIRRRPEHYAQLWPTVPLDMPVLWPRTRQGAFDFSVTISQGDRAALLRGELFLRLADHYLGRIEA